MDDKEKLGWRKIYSLALLMFGAYSTIPIAIAGFKDAYLFLAWSVGGWTAGTLLILSWRAAYLSGKNGKKR